MVASGNAFLKIPKNPPSLTPTAPGDGIPETVAYRTACNVRICQMFWLLNPKDKYRIYLESKDIACFKIILPVLAKKF